MRRDSTSFNVFSIIKRWDEYKHENSILHLTETKAWIWFLIINKEIVYYKKITES